MSSSTTTAYTLAAAAASTPSSPDTQFAPASPSDIPSVHRLRGEHAQADFLADVAVCFNWDNVEADEVAELQEQLAGFSVAAAAAA
jgi:hypothetical protein